jgi:hypothetical protein
LDGLAALTFHSCRRRPGRDPNDQVRWRSSVPEPHVGARGVRSARAQDERPENESARSSAGTLYVARRVRDRAIKPRRGAADEPMRSAPRTQPQGRAGLLRQLGQERHSPSAGWGSDPDPPYSLGRG